MVDEPQRASIGWESDQLDDSSQSAQKHIITHSQLRLILIEKYGRSHQIMINPHKKTQIHVLKIIQLESGFQKHTSNQQGESRLI